MPPKDRQIDKTLQNLRDRLNTSTSSLPLGGGLPLPGPSMTPTTINLPGALSQKVAALFNQPEWRDAERRHFSYFSELIKAQIAPAAPDPDESWSGQSIQGYLGAVRELLETELTSLAGRYSSAQWLWYLRHLPEFVWVGKVLTTAAYDATLAEIISSKSRTHSKLRRTGNTLEYPLELSTS